VIQSGTENSFYVSQAYFNIGQMIHKGDGIEKNITRALRYYNQSASYEPYAVYPSLVMKYLALIETSDLSELLGTAFSSFILILTSPGWVLYGIICFFIFYMLFFISLYLQKD
jgi:membrane-bound ClpP family serine protease